MIRFGETLEGEYSYGWRPLEIDFFKDCTFTLLNIFYKEKNSILHRFRNSFNHSDNQISIVYLQLKLSSLFT